MPNEIIYLTGMKCASYMLVVVVVMWSMYKKKDSQKDYENKLIGLRQDKGMLPPNTS